MTQYNNELSQLARQYQSVADLDDKGSMRIKNAIFKTIYDKYLNYVLKRMQDIPYHDHQIILSEYSFQILYSLRMWKGNSQYATYLTACLKGIVREYLKQKSVVNNAKVHHSYELEYDPADSDDDDWG